MQVRMLSSRFGANGALSYVAGTQYDIPDDLALQFIGDGVAVDVNRSREIANKTQRNEPTPDEGVAQIALVSEDAIVARRCTWATKPAPAERIGPLYIEDIGIGGSLWYSNGVTHELMGRTTLYVSGARAGSVIAGTAEALLKNFLIRGGLMGLNRGLQITGQFSYSNSTNTKTFRIRGNAGVTGLAGDIYRASARNATGTVADNFVDTVRNRGSASSQQYGSAYSAAAQAAGVQGTSAFDTSVDWYLSMTGQPGLGGEVVHLESYLIELV